jgi:2'-5' RNA ligase
MRLFIAIEIGPHLAAAVIRTIAELGRRAQDLAPAARISWARPSGLHVTLHFLGDVEAPRAASLARALEAPLALAPFTIVCRGIGAFPPRGAPRVIWAGLEDAGGGLAGARGMIGERLVAAGLAVDARPFHPHLTLARVRDARGLTREPLVEGLSDLDVGRATVNTVTLFESRLRPDGAEHTALVRTKLAG